MMEGLSLRQRLWIGPILLVGGVALFVAFNLHFAADLGLWEDGALYVARTYEHSLPILGFGCVLPQVRLRWSATAIFLFVFGLGLGLAGETWLISATWDYQALWPLLDPAIGPLSCLVAGLSLVAPDRLRIWILLPAALILGATLGTAIQLNDPSLDDASFAVAAAVTALWLAVAIALTWHLFERPWFRIAGRIFASWLVAIGVILGGAMLAPRPNVAVPPAPPPAPDNLAAPLGYGPTFPTLDQPPMPGSPPGIDLSRQP